MVRPAKLSAELTTIEASPYRARASRPARQLLLSCRASPPLRGGECPRPYVSVIRKPVLSVQCFSQVSATFAARKIVALGIFGVRFGNGLMYSQTISPAGVTSKMRPFEPSQMSVFPLG